MKGDGTLRFSDLINQNDLINKTLGQIRYRDTTVTTGQILALNATPITLIPAPGANKILVFSGGLFFLDYNSAGYAGIGASEDLYVKYADSSGTVAGGIEATGFLDQTSDQWRLMGAYGVALSTTVPQVNAPLVLHMSVGEITTGNSPLKVRAFYRTVDIAALIA